MSPWGTGIPLNVFPPSSENAARMSVLPPPNPLDQLLSTRMHEAVYDLPAGGRRLVRPDNRVPRERSCR